jgi:hypothetical protein
MIKNLSMIRASSKFNFLVGRQQNGGELHLLFLLAEKVGHFYLIEPTEYFVVGEEYFM